jgi:hypothetical protein
MGLRKLSRDLAAVHQALSFKATDILPIEQVQRDKLKKIRRGNQIVVFGTRPREGQAALRYQ